MRPARLTAVVIALGLIALWLDPAPASSHNWNTYSCYPMFWTTPPNNEIWNMRQANSPVCSAVPAFTYSQQSGYQYVTWGDPDGWAWFYVQHNPDEYTQLQLDGPQCANSGTWPYCSTCWCSFRWWGYWQQNPDQWKQQQINTWRGGPYWYRSGWF